MGKPKRNRGRRLEDTLKTIALILSIIYGLMDAYIKYADWAFEKERAEHAIRTP